ncbi:MAG: ATP-dependent helicase [Lachnospiraceae bacterium]|nr:ATP-dependent helicase [Lachnospiraceae bacterium]
MERERLIEFYQEAYCQAVRSKGSSAVRIKDLPGRAKRLYLALKGSRSGRVGFAALEDYHKQIRNVLSAADRRNNTSVKALVLDKIIPELVRLDLSLLMDSAIDGMDEGFLEYLRTRQKGAICQRPLFTLYPAYKEEVIRAAMTELVPVRPEMEFPDTLEMKRHFILHIGPTNSGKTFQALERLKSAKRGCYLGPLRLLALEVYERMQDYGVPATMLTGQECIEDENSRITAATVEMADLDLHYNIAVIDEAQLMADPDRGHSWTRAILGLRADEIHVCASPAAEKVLLHLIEISHDTVEVHHYERKTQLLFEDKPFRFPRDVKPGDALIVFSKKSVLDVAGRLEETGVECSVIYGSLPPEIRRRQMHLFTDGYTEVVVSTDAIGMGLNLPVRRIIFLQVTKYDGTAQRLINTSEVRQIAGRAGRFGIYDPGYITAGDEESLDYIRRTYEGVEPEVTKVNIGFPKVLLDIQEPLDEILKVWHNQTPEAPFEKENVDEALFLYDKARAVASQIDGFDDKRLLYRMISTPIDIKDHRVVSLWLEYCMKYSADVSLPKPRLDQRDRGGLMKYETYYKQLDLYYQMSYRLGKEMDEGWIIREREKTENRIMRYLLKDKSDYIKRCRYCGRMLPIDSPFNSCDRCFKNHDAVPRRSRWR